MKKYIYKSLLIFAVPLVIFGSCKKINPVAGVEEIVDATFTKASVSVQFIDAKTGVQLDLNGNEDIKVNISGRNASDVVTNINTTMFNADYGVMGLVLREGVVPSLTNQIEFSIHATATGYLPASTQINVLQEGHQHILIKMAKITDAPDGLSLAQGTINGVPASGIIASAFDLSPSVIPSTGTSAYFNMPAGTKLMDKNNAAVSGNITGTLAYFNPMDDGARDLFPGDYSKSQLNDGQGVSFNPIGWVDMSLVSSNGKEIKNFGSSASMTISIPDGYKNFENQDITAGMSFGVYSYDETTSTWNHESDEVVVLNSTTGKLEVTFDMDHLSIWQVADKKNISNSYSYNAVTFQGACPDYFNNASDIMYEFNSRSGRERYEQAVISLNKTIYIVSVHQNNVPYGPWNAQYKWYKKDNPSDFITASAEYNANPTVQLPASWCPTETAKEFKIKLTTSCPSNPGRKIKPQCFVYAFEEGQISSTWIPVGEMKNGELMTSTGTLKKNKKYTLMTIYNNKIVALTGTLQPFNLGAVTIDGNDVDLSRPLTSTECTYLTSVIGG